MDLDFTNSQIICSLDHGASANIIGEKVFYFDRSEWDGVNVTLTLDKKMPIQYYNENQGKFSGLVTRSDNNQESITPEFYWLNDGFIVLRYRFGAGTSENLTFSIPELDITKSVTIPSGEIRNNKTQVDTYKPYVKVNTTENKITSLEWYFVDSSDKKIAASSSIKSPNIIINLDNGQNNANWASGSYALDVPFSQLKNIAINFTDSGFNYAWYFDYYGNYNNLTLTWDDDGNQDLSLIMKVGDTKTLTLTPSIELVSIDSAVRNHNIVRSSNSSVSDNSISVTFKALETGQTNITIAGHVKDEGQDPEGNTVDGFALIAAYPREIWVTRTNPATDKKEVPGVTKDLDALIEKMTSSDVISGGTEGGGG